MSQLLTRTTRIASIDSLRGCIMVLMALDHVRDYFHVDAITGNPLELATTTPALFFTRWITHFCAPIFVFLSGLSAFIAGQRKTKKQLSSFLIKRGLWLVLVEIVVMTFILTFNPYFNIIFLLVLWAIGWSMVILGLLVRTSYKWIVAVGLVLFFGHNIVDHVTLPASGAADILLKIFFTTPGTFLPISATHFVLVTYAILPWTGIMLLGYAVGWYYQEKIAQQLRISFLWKTGLGLLLLFVALRVINVYGDPSAWATQKNGLYTFLSFLNVTKYPVSLLYSCLTLGVGCCLLALLENKQNKFTRWAGVYGKVPFFYYVVHFLLAHLLCSIAFLTLYPGAPINDGNSPFLFRSTNFGFSLPIVYVVWVIVVLLLYFPCRWYGKYKQTHTYGWLSYL